MDKDKKVEYSVEYYVGIGIFNSMLKKDLISQTEYDNMTKEYIKQLKKELNKSDKE